MKPSTPDEIMNAAMDQLQPEIEQATGCFARHLAEVLGSRPMECHYEITLGYWATVMRAVMHRFAVCSGHPCSKDYAHYCSGAESTSPPIGPVGSSERKLIMSCIDVTLPLSILKAFPPGFLEHYRQLERIHELWHAAGNDSLFHEKLAEAKRSVKRPELLQFLRDLESATDFDDLKPRFVAIIDGFYPASLASREQQAKRLIELFEIGIDVIENVALNGVETVIDELKSFERDMFEAASFIEDDDLVKHQDTLAEAVVMSARDIAKARELHSKPLHYLNSLMQRLSASPPKVGVSIPIEDQWFVLSDVFRSLSRFHIERCLRRRFPERSVHPSDRLLELTFAANRHAGPFLTDVRFMKIYRDLNALFDCDLDEFERAFDVAKNPLNEIGFELLSEYRASLHEDQNSTEQDNGQRKELSRQLEPQNEDKTQSCNTLDAEGKTQDHILNEHHKSILAALPSDGTFFK